MHKAQKASSCTLQADGMVGMAVSSWLDTMGIINPKAAAKPTRPAAPPADSARQPTSAGPPAKRIRKPANPEKHLAELKALLAAHGEPCCPSQCVSITSGLAENQMQPD